MYANLRCFSCCFSAAFFIDGDSHLIFNFSTRPILDVNDIDDPETLLLFDSPPGLDCTELLLELIIDEFEDDDDEEIFRAALEDKEFDDELLFEFGGG